MNDQSSREFTFGKNWRRFLRSYTPERQKIARECLLNFLQMGDLKGKSFLDIGCGSGIHSAAALLAGAERIYSFDYDRDSVAATEQLCRHHGSPAHWTVAQGSVLDEDFMRGLGTFDVVYAWGMLHHTGDQWRALRNAALPVGPQSRLYIALYAKEAYPDWSYWITIKQHYNHANKFQKILMEMEYVWKTILGRNILNIFSLPKIMWQYQNSRGMDLMTDVRDWLGGWPTEFSSVPEIMNFTDNTLGLKLVNLHTGEGNSEFLLVPKEQAAAMGYHQVSLVEHYSGAPDFYDVRQLPLQPVWIFGTARGGDLIFKYLSRNKINIAGFIDIEKQCDRLHRLPVLQIDDFIQQQEKTTPVIMANRYYRENSTRLREAGFISLFNAHRLVIRLNYHRSAKTVAV
jgi:2-polyprenyl-3-methyl-5-hydroxy-6-metoxy-1,4-benzoquinol methylase